MFQLEKMPLVWFLLNILKSNFATYDWFWADESHILYSNTPFYAANNAESMAVLHDTISWT